MGGYVYNEANIYKGVGLYDYFIWIRGCRYIFYDFLLMGLLFSLFIYVYIYYYSLY